MEELEKRDLPTVFGLTPGSNLVALQDVPFAGVVATFTDSNVGGINDTAVLANIHASLDWGDGHTSAGLISELPSGLLQVSGSNTYTQSGFFPVTITINDDNDHTSGSAVGSLTVKTTGRGPFLVTAQDIAANAGEAFSGLVATIQDPNPLAVPGKLLVRINWGDGSVLTDAQASGPDAAGLFDVRSTHTYARSGTYTVRISVLDSDSNQTATASGTAVVLANPATFSLTGVDVSATPGVPFSQVVGILHDSAANAAAANLTATISWGDGTPLDTGRVVATSTAEFFQVLGTHAYGHAGTYSVHVWVRDSANALATDALANATVTMAPVGALSVTGVGVSTTAAQSFSQLIAVIEDTNANASAGNLTATISWGDGSSVQTVAVSPTGTAGLFQVLAGHTYASTGTDQITIWVTDTGDGQSAIGASTATVGAALVMPPAPPPPPPPAPLPPAPLPPVQLFRRHHRSHARHRALFAEPVVGLRPF
jgi:hypothetical protein